MWKRFSNSYTPDFARQGVCCAQVSDDVYLRQAIADWDRFASAPFFPIVHHPIPGTICLRRKSL